MFYNNKIKYYLNYKEILPTFFDSMAVYQLNRSACNYLTMSRERRKKKKKK